MITATVQIVLDVVRHGYVKISDFNLMIFDECHNAQKDHPMLLLMAKFNEYPVNEHPRVIGLTGMLTAPSIKPSNVLTDLENLEARFRAVIKTAQGDSFKDVLIHSTCPTETVVSFETNLPSDFEQFLNRMLKKMIATIAEWPMDETSEGLSERRNEKQPKIAKKFETICKEFIFQLGNLGMFVFNKKLNEMHAQIYYLVNSIISNFYIDSIQFSIELFDCEHQSVVRRIVYEFH